VSSDLAGNAWQTLDRVAELAVALAAAIEEPASAELVTLDRLQALLAELARVVGDRAAVS
jgi:hypothetical protein